MAMMFVRAAAMKPTSSGGPVGTAGRERSARRRSAPCAVKQVSDLRRDVFLA